MRPVSIDDFIRIVHGEDSSPPSPATVRRQCGQTREDGSPMIPGAYKMGKPWKIDLDAYFCEMNRRISGSSGDTVDEQFIDELEQRLAG